MRKKQKKNKNLNINQKSFYFEDYLDTNKKNKKVKNSSISQDRVYLLFFLSFGTFFVSLFLPNLSISYQEMDEFLDWRLKKS